MKLKMERLEKKYARKVEQNKQSAKILSENEIDKRYINWELVKELLGDEFPSFNPYPFAYMLDRGFTVEILEEWQIGWDDISQGLSIPIRDELGNLIGFKVRFPGKDANPRYKYLGGPEYGFETIPAHKYLFGIDKCKLYLRDIPTLIVVEGELNAISMHQKGFKNVVGISGRYLSDYQLLLIKKYSRTVSFLFDEKKDSISAAKSINKDISAFIFPEHEKDPAEMTKEELWKLYANQESTIML